MHATYHHPQAIYPLSHPSPHLHTTTTHMYTHPFSRSLLQVHVKKMPIEIKLDDGLFLMGSVCNTAASSEPKILVPLS